jgi:hypothetical protein
MAGATGENGARSQTLRSIDVLLPGVVEVHTGERTYRLRDDIGAMVGLLLFRLQALARELPTFEQAAEMPVEEIEARSQAYGREQVAACGAIFRHTYPEMSDDEVARALPTEQARQELILVFFTIRFPPSTTPPSGPAGTTGEPGQQPAGTAGDDAVSASSALTPTGSRSMRGGTVKSKR